MLQDVTLVFVRCGGVKQKGCSLRSSRNTAQNGCSGDISLKQRCVNFPYARHQFVTQMMKSGGNINQFVSRREISRGIDDCFSGNGNIGNTDALTGLREEVYSSVYMRLF
ncbi:hypothetical protein J6590_091316 [Homalodisca vitripennis]|nr:hypothetical protein J6590_091316 [Homalodisca vitripennis]